jgi:hypothetical protein
MVLQIALAVVVHLGVVLMCVANVVLMWCKRSAHVLLMCCKCGANVVLMCVANVVLMCVVNGVLMWC